MKKSRKVVFATHCIALAVFVLVFSGAGAHAQTMKSWSLQQSDGDVRLVTAGVTPIALTDGDTFSGGDWIETGSDGRAVLVRGDDTIVVAPNSRIGLPAETGGGFATRILQTLGTIMLSVEKKATQHFEVKTPYLAAVVKGTTFTVTVADQQAFVHVVEGLVEVRDLARGQIDLVRPGETREVQSPATPVVPDDLSPGSRAEAPARQDNTVINETLGSPIAIASATQGLIREAGSDALTIGGDSAARAPTGIGGLNATSSMGATSGVSTTSTVSVTSTTNTVSGALGGVTQNITETTGTLNGVVEGAGSLLDPVL